MVFFIDADPNDVDMPLMTHRQIGVLQNGKCQVVASLQLSASRQTLWLVRRENWMNQQVDIPHTKKRRKVGGAWVKRRNISYFYIISLLKMSLKFLEAILQLLVGICNGLQVTDSQTFGFLTQKR